MSILIIGNAGIIIILFIIFKIIFHTRTIYTITKKVIFQKMNVD